MKVIIHFGFPKTGSSTLQYGLFKPLHDKGELILRTWRQNNMEEHHDRRPSSCLFKKLPILDEYIDFDKNKINILSDESFTAPTRLRKNNFGENILNPIEFPELISTQIRSKYGNNIEIEAFITIRNQSEQIFSQYVEEYNLKKYKNIDLVFDEKGNIDISGFEIYKYNEYINKLEAVFSPKNVHVTLFEDWKQNFSYFSEQLANIFEIPAHVIRNQLTQNHVNKKKKNKDGYFTKDGKTFIPNFSNLQKTQIKKFFEEDNLLLQKRFEEQYDLKKLGYLRS